MTNDQSHTRHGFPRCHAALGEGGGSLFVDLAAASEYDGLLVKVTALAGEGRFPAMLPDLLRVEKAYNTVLSVPDVVFEQVERLTINSTLQVLPVAWSGLDRLLADPQWNVHPAGAGEVVMVWRHPMSREVHVEQAIASDLLALKVLAEELNATAVALEGGVAVGVIDAAIAQAVERGIVITPPSALIRPPSFARDPDPAIDPAFLRCQVFSVQWHITQTCDLHCKHCYDRTSRGEVPLARGIAILDDIRAFCRDRHAHGQVTFSGGNPLLHPHFLELYQAAVNRYLGVAILGNPASRHAMEAMAAIAKPLYYQVSLEGLPEHNDYIRGRGHFARVMEFLPVLKELGIYSMVMLTLTRDNQGQVLALAELLRDKVDLFTFNRLAMVGEGASLLGPDKVGYRSFLGEYQAAARSNPCMGLKDNLFNLLALEEGREVFGGCAGHGCGAAFNFVSIVADGEVHACRKFPSPIGNIFTEPLAAIYDSARAEGYRSGSVGCVGCRVRPVCGGCLAVVHGLGLDPLRSRDPYCWLDKG